MANTKEYALKERLAYIFARSEPLPEEGKKQNLALVFLDGFASHLYRHTSRGCHVSCLREMIRRACMEPFAGRDRYPAYQNPLSR
jgi:hypothetical protein